MPQECVQNSLKELRLSRLLMLSERKYQRFLAPVLRENNVGASDYPVLLGLYHAQNAGIEALSQTEIAELNIQDKGLVTRAVKKLVKEGRVTTTLDPTNKSRHLVSLTEKGYKTAQNIDASIRKWENEIWDTFNEEDRSIARELFHGLYKAYLGQ